MIGGVTGGLETEVPHRGSKAELLVGDWGLRLQKLTYIFVFKMNLRLKSSKKSVINCMDELNVDITSFHYNFLFKNLNYFNVRHTAISYQLPNMLFIIIPHHHLHQSWQLMSLVGQT
jgi:hypothetical protein